MNRRNILGVTGLAALGVGLAACCKPAPKPPADAARDREVRRWKMVTAWPAELPGLGMGASLLAELITRASDGRIEVKVFAGNELVPAFETFDAVSRGEVEMGHSAAYFWKDKAEASPFFCTIPFGLTAQEMNGWLYSGGGMELWRELYAPFNLVPFPAGNTGVQMAGWFKREIHSIEDLNGLKMRIPGLGGEVMARLGVTPVNLPGAELFAALQSGAIDATEWVGPYNDLSFGLHRAARYCYYPGWQEPGPTLECIVHKPAYDGLPDDLKAIVEICCRAVNDAVLAEYTARNQQALHELINAHQVHFLPLPADVMGALKQATDEVIKEICARDAFAAKVFAAFEAFRLRVAPWHRFAEVAYFATRG